MSPRKAQISSHLLALVVCAASQLDARLRGSADKGDGQMVAKKTAGGKANVSKLKLKKETLRDLNQRVTAGVVKGGALPGTRKTVVVPTQGPMSMCAKGC
jgi:hypothetical protein